MYLLDEADERKRGIAERIVYPAIEERSARISYQVVQETLNVITKKFAAAATPEGASRFLDDVLLPLWRGTARPDLYRHALQLPARYGYSFYDSLIVAAAIEAGCDRLYSEDLQHGQRIEGVTIENPFA